MGPADHQHAHATPAKGNGAAARMPGAPQRWTCPMHPEVIQDRPGTCPICHTALVPVKGSAQTGAMDHDAMVRDMRAQWLWTNFTVMALGLWLATSPATFGYGNTTMTWSDVISGVLLVVLGAVGLRPTVRADFWGRWGACFVGVWLQFAPLVFWAPDAAPYLNDTIVGAFVIALTILVPMMPGMAHHMAMMKPGPEIPPGWTYNPSSWHQRAPLAALGFIGWFISRYLAAVQLGYIPAAWEPFFGPGTDRVLHSKMSQMWPISDAGLGAAAYTFEALMAFMGGIARWRTMPWMVTFFGILVIPLGITHIVLVISQPVVVGEWCTLCLAAAAVMLVMIPLTVDEVVAMIQFMVLARREGKPLWRTFWVGGTIQGGAKDERTPHHSKSVRGVAPAMIWGVTAPWGLIAGCVLGLWLMFAPAVLGTTGAMADSDHLIGAIVLTIAACSMAEVIRAVRFLNVPLGIWVALSPWLLEGDTTGARWNAVAAGLLVALVSFHRGRVRQQYGAWDRAMV